MTRRRSSRPSEAVQLVRVSVKTLGRWARQHATFPVAKVGGVLRYRRDPLLAWLNRQQSVAARRSTRRSLAPAS
jgi:predicted site-specific integrase-resolvase